MPHQMQLAHEPDTAPSGDTPLCRRLWPSDREAVSAHFQRLDPETLASRFMAPVGERTARAYAKRAFVNEGLVYGCFVDGTLRGVGELRPGGRSALGLRLGRRAEAAFTVERDYRRRGIGATLFRRIVGGARNRGVGDVHVRCFTDNASMRRLAIRLGAELKLSGPETNGTIRLDRPTPFSLWYESIAEAFDMTLAAVTPSARQAQPERQT